MNEKQMSRNPRISVGMPVFNGEKYIEEAIRCILAQTYKDYELIISDNASTDRTSEICQEFASQDDRISYIRNSSNIGASNNYNQLFERSSAEYFRWFNADDRCAPTLHERCVDVLDQNPEAVLCYGKTHIIDGESMFTRAYDDNLDLRETTAAERFLSFFEVVGNTNAIYGLMRRSAMKHTGLMGNGSFPASDTIFMAEMTLYGKFIEIEETLFYRRMHEEASSWDRGNIEIQEKFWTGTDSRFVLPSWKKYLRLLKAIRTAPINRQEKWKLKKYIYKVIRWGRVELTKEILLEIRRILALKK